MKPTRIIWHHSADSSERPQLQKIDAYHKSRDFPYSKRGYYVGYHYLIERDGTIIQCRDEDEIGAHDTGENLNSIGICFSANFSAQTPNEAQSAAGAILCGEVMQRWGIPITRIEPHRWDDDTECPGRLVEDRWLIKNYLTREKSPAHRAFYWLGEKLGLL